MALEPVKNPPVSSQAPKADPHALNLRADLDAVPVTFDERPEDVFQFNGQERVRQESLSRSSKSVIRLFEKFNPDELKSMLDAEREIRYGRTGEKIRGNYGH